MEYLSSQTRKTNCCKHFSFNSIPSGLTKSVQVHFRMGGGTVLEIVNYFHGIWKNQTFIVSERTTFESFTLKIFNYDAVPYI